MSSNLPALNPTALAQGLSTATARLSAEGGGDGMPFLRILKDGGLWVYGEDDIEVEEGSEWAVNPTSFAEGYIAWHKREVEGEEMAPMTGNPVIKADLPDVNAKDGWQKQVAFQLVCLNGEDEGMQVLFKSSSKGGIKGTRKLVTEVVKQLTADPDACVPVISLQNDSYEHRDYGKIYNPIFKVLDWVDMEGITPEGEPEPEKEPEPEPKKPARKSRAAAKKAEEPEPEQEPQKPARRRRRIAGK
jgi:hypothetical protein